jgi:hypothetical protein
LADIKTQANVSALKLTYEGAMQTLGISSTGNLTTTGYITARSGYISFGDITAQKAAIYVNLPVDWALINYDCIRDVSEITPLANGAAYCSFDNSCKATTDYDYNHLSSYQDRFTIKGGGTITDMRGFWSWPQVENAAGTTPTITNRYGFTAWDFYTNIAFGGMSCGTQYGFHCAELTYATTNWAVYTEGATPSKFGGAVSMASIATDSNEAMAFDVISHTINASDASNSYITETWSKATAANVAFVHCLYYGSSTISFGENIGTHELEGSFTGTTITVTDVDSNLTPGDVIQIFVAYKK